MTMRLFSGLIVLVFVSVIFALPLYAAMTACTMPCCQHHRTTQPIVSADMPPCAPECIISADETTAAATRTIVPPSRTAVTAPAVIPVVAIAETPVAAMIERDFGPPASDAPLHVLNSVFRI